MNAAAGWDKAVAKDNGVFAQKDTPATSPQSADAPAAPLLKAAVTVPPHIDLAPSIAERPLAKLPWARLHLSSFIQACVRQEPSIKSIGELAAIIRTSRSDIPVGNVLKALSGQVDILYTVQNGFSATGEAMAAAARLSPEAAFAKALATKNIRVGVRPDPGIALDGKAPIL
jgi:hypothetical protein